MSWGESSAIGLMSILGPTANPSLTRSGSSRIVPKIGNVADPILRVSPTPIDKCDKRMGSTTMPRPAAIIFDADGNQLLDLEIQVDMDMAGLHALIERHVPGARIEIEAVNGSILVTGNTNSLSQSDQVLRLVRAYSGAEEDSNNIVNMMSIHAGDQVMLQVRLIEMQRNVVKQLGINLSGVASRMSGGIFGEGTRKPRRKDQPDPAENKG